MFEEINEIFFENTKTEAYHNDSGKLTMYRITPNKGYAIHTIFHDTQIYDEITGDPTGEIEVGYTESYITIRSDYDFEGNPYDIYTLKRSDI